MHTNQVLLDRQLSKKTLRALVLSLAAAKDPAKPDVVIAAALSEIGRK